MAGHLGRRKARRKDAEDEILTSRLTVARRRIGTARNFNQVWKWAADGQLSATSQ